MGAVKRLPRMPVRVVAAMRIWVAIRIDQITIKKPVGLLSPVANATAGLRAVSSFVRHIRESDLRAAQFPEEIVLQSGAVLSRPALWG
jgi:hypothetical protein